MDERKVTMPFLISKDYAVQVKLSAEDLKELLYMVQKSPADCPQRSYWINTLKDWMKK